MKRLAFGTRHLAELFGFAEYADRLVGDLLAEGREADEAAGALDKGNAEQRLQLAKAGGQSRLGNEAGVRSLAEMPVSAERNKILQLLQGWEVDGHLIDKSNH